MTYLSGTFSDVTLFAGPAFPQAKTRRVILGVFVIGLTALVAAWAIAAMAAAWVVAASLATNPSIYQPNFYQKVPVAPKTIGLANPYGTLAGIVDVSHWDLVSTDPGVASNFSRDAELSPPAAVVPSPRVAPPAAAPAPIPPVAQSAAAAAPAPRVPLPPNRASEPANSERANSGRVNDAPLPPSPPVRPHVQQTNEIARLPVRQARLEVAAPPASPTAPPQRDTRNPFVRFFDALTHPSGAQPQDGLGVPYGGAVSLPAPGSRIAVYDIAAHTVYLPDGERLEAHSGLGNRIDDPRHVNEKDRGATPPHVYDLVLRKQLFHGVSALRLNPVGGGSMYGRVGLLAHTYMLGPNGQSNGCVSFRDYRKFLQAFLTGQVQRLVVVTHLGAAPSRVASTRRSRGLRYASE